MEARYIPSGILRRIISAWSEFLFPNREVAKAHALWLPGQVRALCTELTEGVIIVIVRDIKQKNIKTVTKRWLGSSVRNCVLLEARICGRQNRSNETRFCILAVTAAHRRRQQSMPRNSNPDPHEMDQTPRRSATLWTKNHGSLQGTSAPFPHTRYGNEHVQQVFSDLQKHTHADCRRRQQRKCGSDTEQSSTNLLANTFKKKTTTNQHTTQQDTGSSSTTHAQAVQRCRRNGTGRHE